ncbi:hypothetical protein [Streptomyces platensis]|uniref:hypothetical protein n=1 Tax=Streptomyces platensis TaxID=58346 RepID=UPI0037BC1757
MGIHDPHHHRINHCVFFVGFFFLAVAFLWLLVDMFLMREWVEEYNRNLYRQIYGLRAAACETSYAAEPSIHPMGDSAMAHEKGDSSGEARAE